MRPITFSTYLSGQEYIISDFIRKVYDECVAPDYSDEGNTIFYQWIAPENIALRQTQNRTIFTASVTNQLVGIIEMRNNNRISLLFVDKLFHKKGIARALVHFAIQNCLKNDPQLEEIYVHASPYSIKAYEKLGFKAMGKMQQAQGIIYLPMTLNLLNTNFLNQNNKFPKKTLFIE